MMMSRQEQVQVLTLTSQDLGPRSGQVPDSKAFNLRTESPRNPCDLRMGIIFVELTKGTGDLSRGQAAGLETVVLPRLVSQLHCPHLPGAPRGVCRLHLHQAMRFSPSGISGTEGTFLF